MTAYIVIAAVLGVAFGWVARGTALDWVSRHICSFCSNQAEHLAYSKGHLPAAVCSKCIVELYGMCPPTQEQFRELVEPITSDAWDGGYKLGHQHGREGLWTDLQSGGPVPEEDLFPSLEWLIGQLCLPERVRDTRVGDYTLEEVAERANIPASTAAEWLKTQRGYHEKLSGFLEKRSEES